MYSIIEGRLHSNHLDLRSTCRGDAGKPPQYGPCKEAVELAEREAVLAKKKQELAELKVALEKVRF